MFCAHRMQLCETIKKITNQPTGQPLEAPRMTKEGNQCLPLNCPSHFFFAAGHGTFTMREKCCEQVIHFMLAPIIVSLHKQDQL